MVEYINPNIVPPSLIRELDAMAQEIARKGKDIINLSIGQNELYDPHRLLEAVVNRIGHEPLRYELTLGSPETRENIANFYNRFYSLKTPLTSQNIIVTDGGFGGIRNAIVSIARDGDILLIDRFSFRYILQISDIFDKKLRKIVLKTSPDEQFIPKNGYLNEKISDLKKKYPDKRIIYYTHWGFNPTGLCRKGKNLKDLVEIIEDNKAFLINDIVYHLLSHDDYGVPLASDYASEGTGIVDIDSLAKPLSLMGARAGALITRDLDLIKAAKIVQQYTVVAPNTFAARLWDEVTTNFDSYYPDIQEINKLLYRNKVLIRDELKNNDHIGLFGNPEIGIYAFLELKNSVNATDFAKKLIEQVGVVVVPGVAFAEPNDSMAEKYLRMVVSHKTSVIKEAIERILSVMEDN